MKQASHEKASMFWLVVAFTTIYLVWGSTYLAIRVAVHTLPPFLMTAARFFVAGAAVGAYVAFTRGFRVTRRQWLDNFLIGGLLLLGGTGLVSWAEKSVPSGIATLIISTNPIFTVLADWIALAYMSKSISEGRPSRWTMLGLVVGFIGLGLLVGPSLYETGEMQLEPIPVVVLMIACMFWTIGSLYSRYTHNPIEPLAGAAIQMIFGGFWLGAVSILAGEHRSFDWSIVSIESILAWAYLVVAGSIVAFSTYLWLVKHSTPTMVSTYAYVNPIVAVFLGWLILNEPLNGWIFFAAAVIIAGVALITWAKAKHSVSKTSVGTAEAEEPKLDPQ